MNLGIGMEGSKTLLRRANDQDPRPIPVLGQDVRQTMPASFDLDL